MVAAATLRRVPAATVGHLCVGAGLVAWILVEVAWGVVCAPLQIAVGVIGLAIFVLAIEDLRARP